MKSVERNRGLRYGIGFNAIYTEPMCPKAHVRDFLDIEASDGSSGDERVDSDDERKSHYVRFWKIY